jgi:uncharacterized membrane protein YgcG
MVSRVAFIAALLTIAGSATAAVAGEAETIRIEPRPFYGATVTLEAGVRVYRPLPPTRRVIVNPGGSTPLNLSFKDVRIVDERSGEPAAASASASASASSGGSGVGGYYVPRGVRQGGRHSHGGGGGYPAPVR